MGERWGRQPLRTIWCVLLWSLCSPASAHEVRPGYLELIENAPGSFRVLWKQPLVGDRLLRIAPRFPPGCESQEERLPEIVAGALIERWSIACEASEQALVGEEVGIEGLQRTLTDVLLRIEWTSGEQVTHLLRPEAPALTVGQEASATAAAYLRLGIEHLLLGFDHILFVIGLMFFVKRPLELLKVITSFTVAHSVTLALSTLGLVRLSPGPVEAVIALSILFLAVELSRPAEERRSLVRGRPWLVAFGFGLLHGFGFAGALSEIGLPSDSVALALLLFNLGVEVGQLMIVAVILAGLGCLRLLGVRIPPPIAKLPILAMGVISAYWFVSRVVGVVYPS